MAKNDAAEMSPVLTILVPVALAGKNAGKTAGRPSLHS